MSGETEEGLPLLLPRDERGMARVGKWQVGVKYASRVSECCPCHPKVVAGEPRSPGEGACRSCTLQPPATRGAHGPQVPGCLTPPPAKQPHCCSHPATYCLWCFSSKRTFSYIISLLVYTTTESRWIPLQRHRPSELCLGLKEANHS